MTTEINLDSIKMELSIVETEIRVLQAKKTASSAIRARAHLLNIKKETDKLRKVIALQAKANKETKRNKKQPKLSPEPAKINLVDDPEVIEPEVIDEPEVAPIPIKIKRGRRIPAGRKARK